MSINKPFVRKGCKLPAASGETNDPDVYNTKCNMTVPREVLEEILMRCDGKALLAAKEVCPDWKEIVCYLTKKHNLWKKLAYREIPEYELYQYMSKWVPNVDGHINWEQLYENWLSWHDIKQNIQFNKGIMLKLNKVSCICTMADYVAVGLTNGSVKVFHRSGEGNSLKAYRHLIIQVQSLHFIPSLPGFGESSPPSELLIAYHNQVIINDFGDSYAPGVFNHCYIFCTYKHFICGVSEEGHITIAKMRNDEEQRRKSYQVLTHMRIYSPDKVKSCTLCEGVCIILVNNRVRLINYKDGGNRNSHFMAVELTHLQFSTRDNFSMRRDVFIFSDKVIISVTKSLEDIMQQQLFELFILHDEAKRNSKKMFIPWRVFNAFITCICLYGNTLVIGLSSGYAYFYVIDDWKFFDISNFSDLIAMTEYAPIISIDVVESYGERVFYIATQTFVAKWTGQTVNALKF